MKIIGVLLITLLIIVPANAVVVTCVDEGGDVVRIDYSATDEQLLPIAFALDLTADGGAIIESIHDYKVGDSSAASRGFGIFPASMTIDEKGVVADWGTPDMKASESTGVQPGLGTAGVTIGMASRYEGQQNAPLATGTLCRIRVDRRGAPSVNVRVAQNVFGGGVVLENAAPARFTGVGCTLGAPATVPPQAPASITYPSSSSTGSYTVSWPASTGATSYQLERSADGGSNWSGVSSGAAVSYAETVANGSYRYRVRATNSAGPSAWRTGSQDCVVSLATPPPPGTGTVGNTTVFSEITDFANRRAAPYTMSEAGALRSISIYHQGGSGQTILAVYGDSAGKPGTRLAVTASTTINRTAGWQTVTLQSPVSVSAGQKIWLAWVFQYNPGVRFTAGTPGRAQANATWSGGMPSAFGTSTVDNYIYSIYASYNTEPAPTTYTLSISAANGTVTRTPNKTSYTAGETVTLQATPNTGYTFTAWSGDLTGTANPATLVMNSNKSVTANFTSTGGTNGTVGNTTVFSGITDFANRRAAPYTMSEAGTLQRISIYHQGGSGRMILAVYGDSAGKPGTRLGVTASTTISRTAGWQTVALQDPVSVSAGRKIWLAWVFQYNPGVRFAEGTPGRAQSGATWPGGMPNTFGTASVANYIYSIYANYSTEGSPPDDNDDDEHDDD